MDTNLDFLNTPKKMNTIAAIAKLTPTDTAKVVKPCAIAVLHDSKDQSEG